MNQTEYYLPVSHSLETILFVADNKQAESNESQVYLDKGEIRLRFGFWEAEEGAVTYLSQSVFAENKWDLETLYAYAVKNMRKCYPCQCIPLEAYTKTYPEPLPASSAALDPIYILACENEAFPYPSTGLYYSAKEIRELSQALQSELYIFQCDPMHTFLCPVEAFTKEEAAELLEAFQKETAPSLNGQVLVYTKQQLLPLSEYVVYEKRKKTRT